MGTDDWPHKKAQQTNLKDHSCDQLVLMEVCSGPFFALRAGIRFFVIPA
jgi:hypothetical protein